MCFQVGSLDSPSWTWSYKKRSGVTKTNTFRLVVVSNVFGIFTPIPGEMIQYFSNGLVQPPPSFSFGALGHMFFFLFAIFCPNFWEDPSWWAYFKGDLPGTPKDMGPPYGKRDPYYSHIFRDSYGVPENPIDYCFFFEMAWCFQSPPTDRQS